MSDVVPCPHPSGGMCTILSQGSLPEAAPTLLHPQWQIPAASAKRKGKQSCQAGFRPRDSCLQTLGCKKKVRAIPRVPTRGQQRLKRQKYERTDQPLTAKCKRDREKSSPTQRPPRANKHKPQAPVTSFERLPFVKLGGPDDDPPSFAALISGSLFLLF